MLKILLCLYILLWPYLRQTVLIKLGVGIPDITLEYPILSILILYAVFHRTSKLQYDSSIIWLLCFILYCIANSMFNPIASAVGVAHHLIDTYAIPIVIYFIITNIHSNINSSLVAKFFVYGGVLISLIGLAEVAAGQNLYGMEREINAVGLYRTNGPFTDSITYASILLLYISAAFYFIKKGLITQTLGYSSILIFSLGSLANLSRAATFTMVANIWLLWFRNNLRLTIFLVIAITTIIAALFIFPSIISEFKSGAIYQDRFDSKTMAGRWDMYIYILSIFPENPFFGIGYNAYIKTHIYVTHNSHLQVLVELGVFGYILFAGFFYSILLKGLSRTKVKKDKIYFWTKVSIALVALFISNTINLLHSAQFMVTLLISSALIDSHFKQSLKPSTFNRTSKKS